MCDWLGYFVQTILILLSTPLNTANQTLENKIVGGMPVPLKRFPSAVQFFNNGSLCAGSILNSWTVLTAAHCFDVNKKLSEMIVQVGARFLNVHSGYVHEVFSFVIHKDYNKVARFACDIALIFLSTAIKLGNTTKKAIIVNTGSWMTNTEKTFKATGWGWTKYGGQVSKKGLMMTTLEFVSSEDCSRMHGLQLTADMFCLYGGGEKDTCRGDSGGGVMWNNMLVGVTSHGDGCAKKNKPSVYSNVWFFRDWIKAHINKFFDDYCKSKNLQTESKTINYRFYSLRLFFLNPQYCIC